MRYHLKHHLMIAAGLIMFIIFLFRGANALAVPGIGLAEAYVAGGLFLAVLVILKGVANWRAARASKT